MAAPQTRTSAAPKVFEDRVRADAETVSHVLAPDRTADNVRYPDPTAPHTGGQTAPDSIADIQMARRTDAGAYQAGGGPAPRGMPALPWIALGAGLIVILALLVLI